MSINANQSGSGNLGQTAAHLWYKLAGPKPVPNEASFKQRDAVRRAQTSSWILLVVIILDIVPIPGALNKPFALIPILISLAFDLFALFVLNKNKQTRAAGIIALVTIEVGIIATLLSVPGGMLAVDLPLLDLLTQGIIVAAYLIGPEWGFALMLLNIGFIAGLLNSSLISPDLHTAYMHNSNILVQAVEVQVIIAVFSFILVYSSNRAIANLDRSEEIVALERKELQRQQTELDLKEQLDAGIQQLMETHTQVANGNYAARVPLSQDNVLWRVAYSLNNLLARLASNAHLEQERQIERQALHELSQRILTNAPLPTRRTGTAIDELIMALATRQINQTNPAVSPSLPKSEPLRSNVIDERGQPFSQSRSQTSTNQYDPGFPPRRDTNLRP